MRRVNCYLINALTIFCLAITITTSVLWWKDIQRASRTGYERHRPLPDGNIQRHWWFIRSSAGLFELYCGSQVVPPRNTFKGPSHWSTDVQKGIISPWGPKPVLTDYNCRGFGFSVISDVKNQYSGWMLALPAWFIITLTTTAVLLRIYVWRRARKSPPAGHCPTCGYDLRATPHRCPECGTEPARRSLIAA